jgi:invasion protein IalB
MKYLIEWLEQLTEIVHTNKWMMVQIRGSNIIDYYYLGPETGWHVKVPVGKEIEDGTVHYIEDADAYRNKYQNVLHDSAIVATPKANKLYRAIKDQARIKSVKGELDER